MRGTMRARIVIELSIGGEKHEDVLAQVGRGIEAALPGAGNVVVESIETTWTKVRP